MINELINRVADSLHIERGDSESVASWKTRVLYSCVGLHMLSSAYDFDDDSVFENDYSEDTVSMQRVIHRGKQLLNIFSQATGVIYPEMLADAIRLLYIRTGFLLHKTGRLTFPPRTSARFENGYLVRGLEPWNVTHMSGLGPISSRLLSREIVVDDMFRLETLNITEWYHEFERGITWQSTETIPDDLEFLNLERNSGQNYWCSRRPKDGVILCRSVGEREPLYRLIRIYNNRFEQYMLPTWRAVDKEYLRIALALRLSVSNLPYATIVKDGPITYLYLDYLLPPSEQNFLEVYSWPVDLEFPWNRIIPTEMLPLFAEMLSRLGFGLKEET